VPAPPGRDLHRQPPRLDGVPAQLAGHELHGCRIGRRQRNLPHGEDGAMVPEVHVDQRLDGLAILLALRESRHIKPLRGNATVQRQLRVIGPSRIGCSN
jgi:hypothetical protein